MPSGDGVDDATATLLLETLRDTTGRPDLELAAPPTRLSGGFYAEMLRFRLANPPAELDRDLVARIVPHAESGAWEATIQRAVAAQGFPTPAVRLTATDTSRLGRFLIVMDAVDGQPPMAGLGPGTVARQIPELFRHLPDQLARIAAHLHALDAEPLAAQLEALGTDIPTTTAGFVAQQAHRADALGRTDLARAGERLLTTQPPTGTRVITHGDLHPFNLLVTDHGPQLIDWTVSRVAHPGFTIGFTDLMLAHPPIRLPRPGGTGLRWLGRRMARRFRSTYRSLTDGTPAAVDDANLAWHRQVHALRIVVELAGWETDPSRSTTGHPWVVLEPVARAVLGVER